MASNKAITVTVVAKTVVVHDGNGDKPPVPTPSDPSPKPGVTPEVTPGGGSGGSDGNGFFGGGKGYNRTPVKSLADLVRHFFKPMTSVAVAKQLIALGMDTATYTYDYYLRVSDDYEGQQEIRIVKDVFSRSSRTALTIAGTFSVNPLVGVMATVALGGQMALDISKNYANQQLDIDKKNYELSYTRVRAGYSTDGGSTGGDR